MHSYLASDQSIYIDSVKVSRNSRSISHQNRNFIRHNRFAMVILTAILELIDITSYQRNWLCRLSSIPLNLLKCERWQHLCNFCKVSILAIIHVNPVVFDLIPTILSHNIKLDIHG